MHRGGTTHFRSMDVGLPGRKSVPTITGNLSEGSFCTAYTCAMMDGHEAVLEILRLQASYT